jgi:hypothetical protein
MSQLNVAHAAPDQRGAFKVDVSRGERISRVSSEWFSRPHDERYLSLSELFGAVSGRAERSRTRTAESTAIRVEASRDDAERLALIVPGSDVRLAPTHWSFGQLATMVGAPSAYLQHLPAPLAAINLQYGLSSHRGELVKTLEVQDGRVELRAVTGPDYGRIFDHELVSAVQRIAGNGTGDTRWKVPGVLDWSTGIYNPNVDITHYTTTLYASDRDVSSFWSMTSIRSRPDGCPTVRPISISAGSIAGIRRSAPKRLESPAFIFVPFVRIGTFGASRISRRSRSATPNTPPRGSRMRARQR